MKTKWALLVGVIIISAVVGWTVHAQKQTASKVLWEYSVMSVGRWSEAKMKLAEVGNEGWELVSVTETPATHEYGGTVTIYLKRAK